jgi:tetratricopeptide (TPR) repeat protein
MNYEKPPKVQSLLMKKAKKEDGHRAPGPYDRAFRRVSAEVALKAQERAEEFVDGFWVAPEARRSLLLFNLPRDVQFFLISRLAENLAPLRLADPALGLARASYLLANLPSDLLPGCLASLEFRLLCETANFLRIFDRNQESHELLIRANMILDRDLLDVVDQALYYSCLCSLLRNEGHYVEAIEAIRKAIHLTERFDERAIPQLLIQEGLVHLYVDAFPQALRCFTAAGKRSRDPHEITYAAHNRALTLLWSGSPGLAYKTFLASLNYMHISGPIPASVEAHQHWLEGAILADLHQFNDAEVYLQQAYKEFRQLSLPEMVARTACEWAIVRFLRGDLEGALPLLRDARSELVGHGCERVFAAVELLLFSLESRRATVEFLKTLTTFVRRSDHKPKMALPNLPNGT